MRTNKYFISCQLYQYGQHVGNYTHGLEVAGITNGTSIAGLVEKLTAETLEAINRDMDTKSYSYGINDVNFVSINLIDSFEQI